MKTLDTQIDAVNTAHAIEPLRENLNRVLCGKEDKVEMLLTALLARGSVLIEDVPGVGKTMLAAALAHSIDGRFGRIQFTPDLLPGDVTGSSLYNPVTGNFDFRRGPIFCNILLADEINRASPRTQSALLEAMSEGQVTVENQTCPLEDPFMVIATQNPIDFQGTYPLPESQLDRFLMSIELGYPDEEIETELIISRTDASPLDGLRAVMTLPQVCDLRHAAARVRIEPCVARYITALVRATRSHPQVRFGVSVRGSLMLAAAARACAFLQGRGYVIPDDVQRYAVPVTAHRMVLGAESIYAGLSPRQIVEDIVTAVPIPV